MQSSALTSNDKRLKTIKGAAIETGTHPDFFKRLLRSGELTAYKIHTSTYISMVEFESIATPIKRRRK